MNLHRVVLRCSLLSVSFFAIFANRRFLVDNAPFTVILNLKKSSLWPRDAVNAVISEQDSTIEELEEYIAGTGYRA